MTVPAGAADWFRLDRADGVTTVTFDRPPANTLSYEVYDALSRLLDDLESDEATRVVVFASAHPKIFISGADIKDMASYDRRRGAVARKVDTVHATFLRVQRFSKPTIAAIAGHALGGGCEFALCLDFRFMSRGQARIGLPEVNLGIVPGGGGTQRLSRLLGRAKATELLMLGSHLDADEAAAVGLVTGALDDGEETLKAAQELGGRLARQAPVALRGIKRALNDGLDGDLVRGLAVEREVVVEALATEDAREGAAAFLERRPPGFRGR